MEIENAKKELLASGMNLDDFKITKTKNGVMVTPKKSLEQRKIAKEEDASVLDDVNMVAELATINAMDKEEITDLLLFALSRIDELEEKLND